MSRRLTHEDRTGIMLAVAAILMSFVKPLVEALR